MNKAWSPRRLLGALLLAGLTALVYIPALRGGFIWDDNRFLTENPLIAAADGLRRFWLTRSATDYWPLTSTSLWIEWRLWGPHPAGYHATNLLLHLTECLLLWSILRRLKIPGAYLAALLFALHPVNVESVAWITQRKNLVAMLFFLVSIRCFLEPTRRGCVLSLLAFILALLGKGSVAPLPLVLMGLTAWRRPLRARDGIVLAPFFAAAAVFTANNIWFQAHQYTPFRTVGFAERLEAAAAVVWFYAGKAWWPAKLSFVYPSWTTAGHWQGWLPLLAAAAVTFALVRAGRRGGSPGARAALYAWLYFCAMLIPVMGLTDVGFMEFSLVADHYQHLAIIAVTTLAAALVVAGWRQLRPALRPAGATAGAAAVALLAWLSLGQSRTYASLGELYTVALERDPGSWFLHFNLASLLAGTNTRLPEAAAHFEATLRLRPDYAEAHYNLGATLAQIPGREREALPHYEAALRLKPNYAEAHNNLGTELAKIPGRLPEAIAHYEEALRLKPNFAGAHNNLGVALTATPGGLPDAIAHFEAAVRIQPDFVVAHYNLANALSSLPDRQEEALAHYETALRLAPDNAQAENNLAVLYARLGRFAEAAAHWELALRLDPTLSSARENLDKLRANSP